MFQFVPSSHPLLPAAERGTEACSIHPPGRRPFLSQGDPGLTCSRGRLHVVDKLPHLLSTFRAFENPRCLACLGFLCALLWCAVQVKMFPDALPPNDVCGVIKTTHFSVDFPLCRRKKIGISPGRKKVSQGKPTEKRVVFIRARKLCRLSAIQGAPAGKGSPHDSAWIMLLLACCPLNLSKASQFGSTLAGERPLRVCMSGFRHANLGLRRVVLWLGRPFLGPATACCRFFRQNARKSTVRGRCGRGWRV